MAEQGLDHQGRLGAAGRAFDKVSLRRLLTSTLYLGKESHKGRLFAGEHTGIVDPEVWQRAQGLLRRNGRCGGAVVRNSFGALLKGLLRCTACSCSMTPSHGKKGAKRYHYYTCLGAQSLLKKPNVFWRGTLGGPSGGAWRP